MKRRPPFRWVGDRQRNPFVVRRVPRPAPAANIDDLPASCVKVNRSWVPHLLGALESLTQDDAWSQAGYHAQQQIEALMAALVDGTCPDCPPGTTKEVYIQFVEEDCDCEDEHDMKPIYQKFGGTWYIGFPCDSCGGYEWVPLGAGVALDPNGAPLGLNDIPAGGAGNGNTPNLTGDAVGCYHNKIAPYLLARVIDYIRVYTNSIQGVTRLGELIDEIFNITALTANFEQINDDLLWISEFSEEDLEDAFNSQTALDSAESSASATFVPGINIQRSLLSAWADGLPMFISAVPVRNIAQAWSRTANVSAIADKLQKFALECGTGLTLTEPETGGGLVTGEFGDYTIYYVDDPGTFRVGQQVIIQSPGNLGNIVALGFSAGDPVPTAGPNQRDILADGEVLVTQADGGAGISLIGESVVRNVIAANLDDFFPVRDSDTILGNTDFDFTGYNPTEYRIRMTADANPEIFRVVYRFIIVVENV